MSVQPIRLLKHLWVLVVCALSMHSVFAQTANSEATGLYAQTQRWLDQALAAQDFQLPLRMEVQLGQLDPRLRLAACQQAEPYLPPGTRLWGRTRVGIRCVQGAGRWNVFLPVTVKAFGPAWVIKREVRPGEALTASHAMAVEVDWSEQQSPIIANQADWVGKTPTRLLRTGQALRQDMVKAAQVFQAGAQVRVVASGNGFEIASRGQAISAGVVGQTARVRMDNGQVLSGVVADERTVRVLL